MMVPVVVVVVNGSGTLTSATRGQSRDRAEMIRRGEAHENFPAVCFVTAAAIPGLSLACFLSLSTTKT